MRPLALVSPLLLAALMVREMAVADPVVHVLVQLPLLAAAGWLIARLAGMGDAHAGGRLDRRPLGRGLLDVAAKHRCRP